STVQNPCSQLLCVLSQLIPQSVYLWSSVAKTLHLSLHCSQAPRHLSCRTAGPSAVAGMTKVPGNRTQSAEHCVCASKQASMALLSSDVLRLVSRRTARRQKSRCPSHS